MPAPVVKGILITLTLLTTLGIAIYESPQIQAFLEDQRRKLAELLRTIGEELDPQLRRQAEAFAFEGRTPANDEGLRREADRSLGAATTATGRDVRGSTLGRRAGRLGGDEVRAGIRQIAVEGPSVGAVGTGAGSAAMRAEDTAAERRRLGREYLARRNQQMYELQMRRSKDLGNDGQTTPTSPTSFDALVDDDGKLKTPETEAEDPPLQLPSVPTDEPQSTVMVREMEQSLVQPLLAGEASSSQGAWQAGSSFANPFTDEFELERSVTPKPPKVPPKVSLDEPVSTDLSFPMDRRIGALLSQAQPAAQVDTAQPALGSNEDLSYEEQLAIALSLSEADSTANTATVRQHPQHGAETPNDDIRAAIEASLRDMDDQQAAHALAHASVRIETSKSNGKGRAVDPEVGPLVDLTPDPPVSIPAFSSSQSSWMQAWQDQGVQTPLQPMRTGETDDELYTLTPQLTRARLASHDAAQAPPHVQLTPKSEASSAVPSYESPEVSQLPSQIASNAAASFPPLRFPNGQGTTERAARTAQAAWARQLNQLQNPEDTTRRVQAARVRQLKELQPQSYDPVREAAAPAPATQSDASGGKFNTEISSTAASESESESKAFASFPVSAAESQVLLQPEAVRDGDDDDDETVTETDESIEVVDITGEEDSDGEFEVLAASGLGVRTPDSWSEVGSRDGESEGGR